MPSLPSRHPAPSFDRSGTLTTLGHDISHQIVANILEEHAIDPAPKRETKTSWAEFIRAHTDSPRATDFLTTEVWTPLGLVTYYDPTSRRQRRVWHDRRPSRRGDRWLAMPVGAHRDVDVAEPLGFVHLAHSMLQNVARDVTH